MEPPLGIEPSPVVYGTAAPPWSYRGKESGSRGSNPARQLGRLLARPEQDPRARAGDGNRTRLCRLGKPTSRLATPAKNASRFKSAPRMRDPAKVRRFIVRCARAAAGGPGPRQSSGSARNRTEPDGVRDRCSALELRTQKQQRASTCTTDRFRDRVRSRAPHLCIRARPWD